MHVVPTSTIGTCALCHEVLSKAAAEPHAAECLPRHAGDRTRRALHVKVEDAHSGAYWMHMAVLCSTDLFELDAFLRRSWLECCGGHSSTFHIGDHEHSPGGGLGIQWSPLALRPDAPGATDRAVLTYGEGGSEDERRASTPAGAAGGRRYRGLDDKIGAVLRPGLAFRYEYDDGPTGSLTELRCQVVGELLRIPRGKPVQLLVLNEPPRLACTRCGKPAQMVNPGARPDEAALLCRRCTERHSLGPAFSPLVNSPRTGVCGYRGPVIQIKQRRRIESPHMASA